MEPAGGWVGTHRWSGAAEAADLFIGVLRALLWCVAPGPGTAPRFGGARYLDACCAAVRLRVALIYTVRRSDEIEPPAVPKASVGEMAFGSLVHVRSG
jgi:hypothetical protein